MKEEGLAKLLIKIGISSRRLLRDVEGWVNGFYQEHGLSKLRYLHLLSLLSPKGARSSEDAVLITQVSRMLEGADFMRKQGYDEIADNIEKEARAILHQLAFKMSPNFSKRLFLDEGFLRMPNDEEETI